MCLANGMPAIASTIPERMKRAGARKRQRVCEASVTKSGVASMYTVVGFGDMASSTHKLVESKQCARRHAANLYYLGLEGSLPANHFTRMRQLELGSDKELAHMCAWCSRMLPPNSKQKFAHRMGVEGASKRTKSRAKRGGERSPQKYVLRLPIQKHRDKRGGH